MHVCIRTLLCACKRHSKRHVYGHNTFAHLDNPQLTTPFYDLSAVRLGVNIDTGLQFDWPEALAPEGCVVSFVCACAGCVGDPPVVPMCTIVCTQSSHPFLDVQVGKTPNACQCNSPQTTTSLHATSTHPSLHPSYPRHTCSCTCRTHPPFGTPCSCRQPFPRCSSTSCCYNNACGARQPITTCRGGNAPFSPSHTSQCACGECNVGGTAAVGLGVYRHNSISISCKHKSKHRHTLCLAVHGNRASQHQFLGGVDE